MKSRESLVGLGRSMAVVMLLGAWPVAAVAGGMDEAVKDVERLIGQLNSKSSRQRYEAREELARRKDPGTISRLVECLEDEQMRAAVVPVLADMGDAAVGELIAVLRSRTQLVARWRRALEEKRQVAPVVAPGAENVIKTGAAMALVSIGDEAVDGLLGLLGHRDALVRAYAAKALGKIGDPRAFEPLGELLKEADPMVCWNAAWALGEVGRMRAVPLLIEAFERTGDTADVDAASWSAKERSNVRGIVLAVLGKMDDVRIDGLFREVADHAAAAVREAVIFYFGRSDRPGAADVLAGALDDSVGPIWAQAALALGRRKDARAIDRLIELLDWRSDESEKAVELLAGFDDPRCREAVVAALESPNPHTQVAAIKLVGEGGYTGAADRLEGMLEIIYDETRSEIIRALSKLKGKEAVDIFLEHLDDWSPPVVCAAIEALGELKEPRAVEPLIELLKGDTFPDKHVAAYWLGWIGDERAIGPLVAGLSSGERKVGVWSAEGLSVMKSEQSVAPLVAILRESRSDHLKTGVLMVLGRIGHRNALDAVIDALDERGPGVKMAAIRALAQIDRDKAIELLPGHLSDPYPAVAGRVCVTLSDLNDPRAVGPMLEILRNGNEAARKRAAKVLAGIDSRQALDALGVALTDEGAGVRSRAVWSLEHRDDPRVVEMLLGVLGDEDSKVRQAAVWVLSQHEDPRLFDAMVDALDDEAWSSRQAGAFGLGRIGDDRAIVHLVGMLDDSHRYVRYAAALSLARFRDQGAVAPLAGNLEGRSGATNAAMAFALAMTGAPEADRQLHPWLQEADLDAIRGDHGRYLREGRPGTLVALAVVLARDGTLEMAEDFYWSGHSGLMSLGEWWARAGGRLEELEKSTDNEQRPHWPKRKKSRVASSLEKLKGRDSQARVKGLEELEWLFSLYAPRWGRPIFSDAEGVVLEYFGEPGKLIFGAAPLRANREWFASFHRCDDLANVEFRKIADGSEIRRAIDVVEKALTSDVSVHVRRAAAGAMGATREELAVAPLAAALEDASDVVKFRALFELGRLDFPEAARVIVTALEGSDPALHVGAIAALGNNRSEKALEKLVAMMRDDDEPARVLVAIALGQHRDPRALEVLLMRLESDDDKECAAVVAALGMLRDERAVEPLARMLSDISPTVVVQAAGALSDIGAPRAIEALEFAAGRMDLWKVRAHYRKIIRTGNDNALSALVIVLGICRDEAMAVDFFWSNNAELREAAVGMLLLNEEIVMEQHPEPPSAVKWGEAKR